jgi:hypothetical protein
MKAIPADEFLRWAATVGVGFDRRFPDSGCFRLDPPGNHARFWELPADPSAFPHLTEVLLDAMDEWRTGFVWPRMGNWPTFERSGNTDVRRIILRGANVPDGWNGAVSFDREEEDALLAVIFVSLAFGWCVADDLFFVPDHGRQVLHTDHHLVIHLECRTEERIGEVVAEVLGQGYPLPTELPDPTFIRPAWMSSATDGA